MKTGKIKFIVSVVITAMFFPAFKAYAGGLTQDRSRFVMKPGAIGVVSNGINEGDAVFKDGIKIGTITSVNGKSFTFKKSNGLCTSTTTDNMALLGLSIRNTAPLAQPAAEQSIGAQTQGVSFGFGAAPQRRSSWQAPSIRTGNAPAANNPNQTAASTPDRPANNLPAQGIRTFKRSPLDKRVAVPANPAQAYDNTHGAYNPAEGETFKRSTMDKYGFTPQAKEYLGNNINLKIFSSRPWTGPGGGHWDASSGEIHLPDQGDEGAVHELAHAWYDKVFAMNANLGNELIAATNQLANMAAGQNPQYAAAINEAKQYLDGRSVFEIFAGFASFYKAKNGGNPLPGFVLKFYDTLFTR